MKPLFKKYFTTEDANLYTHCSDPFALEALSNPKNSLDVNTLAGCKFTFWQLTLVDRPIWNLDLKYFTNEDDILYMNCSDH